MVASILFAVTKLLSAYRGTSQYAIARSFSIHTSAWGWFWSTKFPQCPSDQEIWVPRRTGFSVRCYGVPGTYFAQAQCNLPRCVARSLFLCRTVDTCSLQSWTFPFSCCGISLLVTAAGTARALQRSCVWAQFSIGGARQSIPPPLGYHLPICFSSVFLATSPPQLYLAISCWCALVR